MNTVQIHLSWQVGRHLVICKRTELFVRGTAPVEVAEEEIIELEAPNGLTAQYNAETSSIGLSWSHNAPVSEAILGNVAVHRVSGR